MPVVPSFGSFAATPDVAQSFLGGARIASEARQAGLSAQVQRERIAAESAEAAARIAFGREQLAAQQVQNQMELDAKTKYYEQKALQDQQEAAIESAYRNIQLGIADRRLAVDERMAKMRVDEAAREFQQQQAYERRRAELIPILGDERLASEQAMRETGFGATGFASVFDEPKTPQARRMDPETASNIKGLERRLSLQYGALQKELGEGEDADNSKIGIIKGDIARMEREKKNLFEKSSQPLTPPPGLPDAPSATATNSPMRGLTIPSTFTNSSRLTNRPGILRIQRRD